MKRLAWSILVTLPFGVAATEVYRSVDENGVVVFSDRPSDSTEMIDVRPVVDRFDATARPDSDDDSSQASQQTAAADSETPATDSSAAERARNCQVARDRSESYSASRRLFRTLPDGEREYLSDAEMDDARARAQSDVANWCG